MTTKELLSTAKSAVPALAQASAQQKSDALLAMARALEDSKDKILAANAQDLAAAQGHISPVMLDRLALSDNRISDMADGIRQVAALPDPVGKVLRRIDRPNGLIMKKRRSHGRVCHHLRKPSQCHLRAAALARKAQCLRAPVAGKSLSFRRALVRALKAGRPPPVCRTPPSI